MKKILIVTTKRPYSNNEVDGGSVTVLQLIESLKENYQLDYLYFQKDKDEIIPPLEGINNVFFEDGSFFDYRYYNKENTNKFDIRIESIPLMNSIVCKYIDNYDRVFIIHCSEAMGLENILTKEQLNKIVLFPMYLTESYRRSGDIVPDSYYQHEKSIMNAVKCIVTPSNIEYRDILNYGINPNKVHMIPRAVTNFNCGGPRKIEEVKNICYVGSFKNQKNNLDAIKVIEILRDKGLKIVCHFLGDKQVKSVYQECVQYVNEHNLNELIVFEDIVPHNKLNEFFNNMDLAICVSLFETFGRGVFEGLAAGLPSIVYKCVAPVYDFGKECEGIKFVDNYKEMANVILEIYKDSNLLTYMSKEAYEFSLNFNFDLQKQRINKVLEETNDY